HASRPRGHDGIVLDIHLRREGERHRHRDGVDTEGYAGLRHGLWRWWRWLVATPHRKRDEEGPPCGRPPGSTHAHDQILHQKRRRRRTGVRTRRPTTDIGSVSTRTWGTIPGFSSPPGLGTRAMTGKCEVPPSTDATCPTRQTAPTNVWVGKASTRSR